MSFKKYRAIDLSMIIVLGLIAECLGVFLSIKAIPLYNPFSVAALAMICLAVTRHGWYGAITIPVFALANALTFGVNYNYMAINVWQIEPYSNNMLIVRGIGCLLSMSSPLILMAFYKKDTNGYLINMNSVAKITAVVALLSVAIVYITVIVNSLVSAKGFYLTGQVYIESLAFALGYQGLGIAIMFALNLVLFRMGTFRNSYQTILERQIERENEIEYYNLRNQNSTDEDDE